MKQRENIFKVFLQGVLMLSMVMAAVLFPGGKVLAESTEYGTLIESGTCGATANDNVMWAVYDSGADEDENNNTGDTIVFSGSGDMMDCNYGRPWYPSYMSELKTVIFEKDSNITSIGDSAFKFCSEIIKVEISDSVKNIGKEAFYNCSSLTEITLPKNLEKIENGTFHICTNLSSVEIPDSVTGIGENAFYECESLSSINIPDNVTDIGNKAFYCCESLTEIILPNSLKNMGEDAFYACSGLKKVSLSNSLEIIKVGTFTNCRALETIMIPDSVTEIGNNAFANCKSLTNVYFKNVEKIGENAFVNSNQLKYEVDADNNSFCSESGILYNKDKTTLISYPTASGNIEIPDSVTKISSNAFCGCSELTGVSIPEGLTSIGNSAFYSCENLNSINIPKGVTSIEANTFSYCYSLRSIEIPDSVTAIGEKAFYYCEALKTIIIPDSVTVMGEHVFNSCTGLTDVTLSKNLTIIESSAFYYCEALKTIIIPDSVTVMGESVFYRCTNLNNVTMSKNLTTIGKKAFYDCTALTDIVIPKGITKIEDSTFLGCTKLTGLVLPENLNTIGSLGLGVNKSMKEIYYPDCLETEVTSVGISSTNTLRGRYTVNEDNTVSITIEYIPEGTTTITLPEGIYGKAISSVEYAEEIDSTGITIECTKHFPGGEEWEKSADEHWFTGCKICGVTEEVREPHEFYNGTEACRCGYVPFTITAQPESENLVYGYEETPELSVLTTPAYDGLEITYQWYENNTEIQGAIESTYVVPTGKNASDYNYYCKISCGEYSLTSDTVIVSIAKTQGIIYVEEGKEEVLLNYSKTPVSLDGVTKTGEGTLVYTVTDGNDVLSVSEDGVVTMKNLGTASISISMAETENYMEAETKNITVKVIKADYPATTPDTPMAVENTVKKVSDVSLPTDWQWDTEDTEKTLPEGKDLEVTANYTGEDKEFYNNISMKVIIQRAACTSSEVLYTGEGEKAPTCTKEGIGHKECTVCGDILESNITMPVLKHTLSKVMKEEATCTKEGKEEHWKCSECNKAFSDEEGTKEITDEITLIIPVSEHVGGKADCSKKAVCEVCENPYGELDKTKHGETEIRNDKSATCKEAGYTGDTYCKDCGQKISSGEEVAKVTTHTWDSGVVTKEATTTEKGVKTYTCSVCGETKTEEIPVIGVTETPSTTPSATETPSVTPSVTKVPSATPTPSVTEVPSTTPTPSVTEVPSTTPTPCVTKVPSTTPTPSVTEVPSTIPIPSVTEAPSATPTQGATKEEVNAPKKGTVLSDKKSNGKYKILVSGTKNGTVEYVKPLSEKSTKANVPATVKINGITYKVVSIGKNAFKNHKAITKVTIGKNVKTIGANAFYGCKKLKTVSIGKNVTTIGDKAFYKCTALTKITIPAKVKKIGKQSFYGCKKLKTITIKTTKLTKKNVGSKSFAGISKKATIKVPKSKVKAYEKMLKTKGIGKEVKVKK